MPSKGPAVWIKDPLAILVQGAERGVVVADGRIVELVRAGHSPTNGERFGVRGRRARRAARLDQHASSFLPDFDPCRPSRARSRAVSMARSPLPGVGSPYPGRARTRHDGGDGRALALRLHDQHRPPLRFSTRPGACDRHRSGGGETAWHARAVDAWLNEPLAPRRRAAAGQRGAGRGHDPRRQRAVDRSVPREG